MPEMSDPIGTAVNFWAGNLGPRSIEHFGWGVLVLVSASELESSCESVKGEKKDEGRDQTLGVRI